MLVIRRQKIINAPSIIEFISHPYQTDLHGFQDSDEYDIQIKSKQLLNPAKKYKIILTEIPEEEGRIW